MATIYDVARKAGVSTTTVSRVLNNHPYVREETRIKVQSLLKELHFIPNSNASSLVRKTTNTIAVILPDVTNHFFTTLLRGAEDQANEDGFAVIFGNTDEDIQKEQTYIQMFLERRIDGLIIAPVSPKVINLKTVIKREIPLVLVDREVEALITDFVGTDNQRNAQSLVEYLIGLGHKTIAIISGSQENSAHRQRIDGYRAALLNAGIPIDERLILYGDKPNIETGTRLVRNLLQQAPRPTTIFAVNNFLAIGGVVALREANFNVPEDIGIVCFDDNDSASVLNPFFTSINQPAYMMGQMAVDILVHRMKHKNSSPTRVLLESNFLIRGSVKPARSID
ncbi:LacI family transcriptional regulator [Hydrogenispora ethanolica]|jgi:LacI family transcriptional regulator|uniref:LacI family transcriptional regulator n=1 Tax=Hydrogenispora ethanolica TaxID=1082276 RepID=A0A4R1R7B6_HYDET|nr:LacI family DNA-binding transcriptional regulator [Hydrogenispora ethanolica]TCL61505.1 LacI family transcriptional regulator [Hydrogenispora ethanolica]